MTRWKSGDTHRANRIEQDIQDPIPQPPFHDRAFGLWATWLTTHDQLPQPARLTFAGSPERILCTPEMLTLADHWLFTAGYCSLVVVASASTSFRLAVFRWPSFSVAPGEPVASLSSSNGLVNPGRTMGSPLGWHRSVTLALCLIRLVVRRKSGFLPSQASRC